MPSTFFPISSLTPTEAERLAERVVALASAEAEIIMDADTSAFIRESIGKKFGLVPDQLSAVARVIAEIILRLTPANHAAEQLMKTAHLEMSVAASVVETIGQELFEPKGLNLANYTTVAAEPILLTDTKGKEGLRYSGLDDLMAELETMDTAGRMKFLEDAKPFNRVFVLQAYSQLKMQADSSGNSLSFRQQVAQEAEEFSALDWIDLLRIDPDSADEPAVWEILKTTALGAMVEGRDVAGRRDVASELAGVSADMQILATSPVCGATIDALVKDDTLPATHAVAAGRVLYFLCVGKILPSQTGATLEKLGVQPEAATLVAQELNRLLPTPTLPGPTPEPTRQPATPIATPVLAVPSAASRNIIDLRKQTSTS